MPATPDPDAAVPAASGPDAGGTTPSAADPLAPEAPDWPGVSVVMPVRDEARHLREAVDAVLAQAYPGPLEVVIGLGPSSDGTEQVVADLAADPRVRAVPNPAGTTPAALNAALAAAHHPVVVRVDGHAVLTPGYLRRAVETLRATGAANVGGVMAAEGVGAFEQAVAAAMRSPLGVGSSRFHTGGEPGPVDTVYLGVFRRDVLVRLGGYDETFLRTQDWELNHRIRQAGGIVWFDPSLEVRYRPRATLLALARQYLHYGRWRREVMRTHPGTAGLRYLAPPAVTASIAGGLAAAGALAVTGRRRWWAGLLPAAGYGLGVVAASAAVGRGLPGPVRRRLPGVVATMHLAWGAGFLTSPRDLRDV